MAHFNIVHVIPEGALNLRAYHEVIDSVRWGLQQLGHEVTYSVNRLCPGARNIIFGGQRAPELIAECPPDAIFYNLEQVRGNPQFRPDDPHPLIRFVASKLHVWDYSGANIDSWSRLGPAHQVRHVPIGYAPVLTRIENAVDQDIDVLIYGSVGAERLEVFSSIGKLANLGISAVFACGMWGRSRDSLIARSKIVLNINHMTHSKIFEIARVSYLMANSKAIVADFTADSYIEGDIAGGILFVRAEKIAETCFMMLADNERRLQLERDGFACISQRDVRVFLASALA